MSIYYQTKTTHVMLEQSVMTYQNLCDKVAHFNPINPSPATAAVHRIE